MSFYNKIFLTCKDTNLVTEGYNVIDGPINLSPNNIPFKNYVELHYEKFSNENMNYGIYSFNGEKWNFQNIANNNNTKTKVFTGGTFAILNENEEPIIKNLTPENGATYNKEDFKKISFNCFDELSGINYSTIKIQLDNKEYYYDYIKYRKLVESKISESLKAGKHSIRIHVKDNLNNSKIITHDFFIK